MHRASRADCIVINIRAKAWVTFVQCCELLVQFKVEHPMRFDTDLSPPPNKPVHCVQISRMSKTAFICTRLTRLSVDHGSGDLIYGTNSTYESYS